MKAPKAAAPRSIKSFAPGRFGSGTNSPIVNHNSFTDARPTIGAPSDSFNPSGALSAGPLPNGPPKYVQAPGRSPKSFTPKGETNKRLP